MQPLRRIALLLIACLEFGAISTAAFAQEPPKIQAGGGYLYIVDPAAAFNRPVYPEFGPGWFGKVTGNVTPHVGAVGEITGSYHDADGHRNVRGSARIHSVLGGVRLRPFCCVIVVPFAHLLAGMMFSRFRGDPPHFSGSDVNERPFALAIGGGVDVRAFHVATDLVRLRHHENYSAWTWRIAAGVMLPGK